jgi:hypothetical protein
MIKLRSIIQIIFLIFQKERIFGIFFQKLLVYCFSLLIVISYGLAESDHI